MTVNEAQQLERSEVLRSPVELGVARLRKSFPSGGRRSGANRVVVVDDVSFTVAPGQLFTLLGPSGCGKTTTLRSIAGLEVPDDGVITVGGNTLYDRDRRINLVSEERGLGMVFQSYAIWPHMTVFQNVSFPFRVGSRRHRPSRKEARRRVNEALELVGLASAADRHATALSGGQQQRLALARALVMAPRVLLLDEPLSNLDARLRESMRMELKRMQKESGVTSIYVTHDQSEALAMSDVVAVMNGGVIDQVGTPDEIYYRPRSRFVAQFIGSTNLLEGRARGVGGQTVVETAAGRVVSTDVCPRDGQGTAVSIRPEDLVLTPAVEAGGGHNEWTGRITSRAFLGESTTFVVQAGDTAWQCRTAAMSRVAVGDEVCLTVPAERVRIVPDGADTAAGDTAERLNDSGSPENLIS